MFRMKYLAGLSMIAIFCLNGIIEAQTQRQLSKIKFTCLLWEGPLEQELFYRDGDNFNLLEVFTGSRSREHVLAKSSEFGLYVKDDNAENPEQPYRLVSKTALLAGTKQILFILFKYEMDEGMGIRVLPVDDSLDSFPAGSFRFANFSNESLYVKFAGRVKKIAPRGMTDMKSNVDASGGLIPFIIGNEAKENMFETRLFAQATGREIVFIGRPKVPGGLPSVRFLPQLLPQKLPSPE
jgi:hypothetical protein